MAVGVLGDRNRTQERVSGNDMVDQKVLNDRAEFGSQASVTERALKSLESLGPSNATEKEPLKLLETLDGKDSFYDLPSRRSSGSICSQSSPKIYKCPEPGCDKCYNRPSLLEQHVKTHTGERNFHCTHPGCDKSFFRAFHLKVHMYSHSSEKLLQCQICQKGFNTNQHLKRHEKIHNPSHRCTSCDAVFYRRAALAKHVSRTHELKWDFPCPHSGCGLGFDKAIKLSKHIANDHSKIPTYTCTHNCQAKFFTWSALQAHIKSSHEKIPCSLCGKLCAGPAAVAQHMQSHNPSPQIWQCRVETCMENPIFGSKAELAAHYQYVHEYVPSKLRGALHGEEDSAVYSHGSKGPKHTTNGNAKKRAKAKGSPDRGGADSPNSKRRKLIEKSSVISLISGAGYETTRKMDCTVAGCNYKFARKYDLKRHLNSFHGTLPTGIDSANPSHVAHVPTEVAILSSFKTIETVDNEDPETIDPLLK